MSGKAWMNGMVPYVDFADSKGPLLWLIYGIGYLISHHSYIGVFWISVLFYTVTLFAAYKLCRLFVDRDAAAVSTAVLPFFLSCFIFHFFEIRGEDFCYTFIMVSLYCVCRILRYRDSDARTYLKLSALMGVCSMCCVLIKYNIGCMIMGLMAVALYMAIRHKAGWQSFAGMALGFVAPAIPFVICFLIYGNMGAFIQEYFLNTFETIENSVEKGWFFEGRSLIKTFILAILGFGMLLILLIGTIYFSRKHKLGYWLVPCFLLFILGLGKIVHSVHYYMVVMPFSIFLVLEMADLVLRKIPLLRKNMMASCAVAVIFSFGVNLYFYSFRKVTDNEGVRRNYYIAAYVMSQVEDPKVLYYHCSDFGIGLPVGSLPACRYWTSQTGATEGMIREIENDLRSGVADFICVRSSNKEGVREVERCGYMFYCDAPQYGGMSTNEKAISVYGRPGLRLPPEDFHVSQWDVWLKRNIFGI